MAKTPRPYRALGRNIAQTREEQALTQEKVAERAELTIRYYQDLEEGFKAPSFKALVRLRKVLGCSWNDLLKGC